MPPPNPETLRLILDDYELDWVQRDAETVWFTAKGEAPEEAFERAARSLMKDGKIHSHQRRPGRAVMGGFAMLIRSHARELATSANFDTLLTKVETLARESGCRRAGGL